MSAYTHRVLYGDCDPMQIVYYANYLRFFEGARNHWTHERGYPYVEIEKSGFKLPVIEAHVGYRAPARYDDVVEVPVKMSRHRARIRFDYEVRRVGEPLLLAEGWTIHVLVDAGQRPVRPPAWLMEKLGL